MRVRSISTAARLPTAVTYAIPRMRPMDAPHPPRSRRTARRRRAATSAQPLLYIGNDGGLWRSTDGSTSRPLVLFRDATHFQNLNSGLGSLAEIVSFAQDPGDPATLLVGLGANGTAATSSRHRHNLASTLCRRRRDVAIDPVNHCSGISPLVPASVSAVRQRPCLHGCELRRHIHHRPRTGWQRCFADRRSLAAGFCSLFQRNHRDLPHMARTCRRRHIMVLLECHQASCSTALRA